MGEVVSLMRYKKIQTFRDKTKPGANGFASLGAISAELMRNLKKRR